MHKVLQNGGCDAVNVRHARTRERTRDDCSHRRGRKKYLEGQRMTADISSIMRIDMAKAAAIMSMRKPISNPRLGLLVMRKSP
jgi:hypothetical protein